MLLQKGKLFHHMGAFPRAARGAEWGVGQGRQGTGARLPLGDCCLARV